MKSRLWRVHRISAVPFSPFPTASEQGLPSLPSSTGITHSETPTPTQAAAPGGFWGTNELISSSKIKAEQSPLSWVCLGFRTPLTSPRFNSHLAQKALKGTEKKQIALIQPGSFWRSFFPSDIHLHIWQPPGQATPIPLRVKQHFRTLKK